MASLEEAVLALKASIDVLNGHLASGALGATVAEGKANGAATADTAAAAAAATAAAAAAAAATAAAAGKKATAGKASPLGLNEVKVMAGQVVTRISKEAAVELIQAVGAPNLAGIPPAKFAEFIALCQVRLKTHDEQAAAAAAAAAAGLDDGLGGGDASAADGL